MSRGIWNMEFGIWQLLTAFLPYSTSYILIAEPEAHRG
jgi:hypothetical protein